MLGVSLGVAALSVQGRARTQSTPIPAPSIRAVLLGQSEIEYLFNSNTTYRQIAQPTVPEIPNLVVFSQFGIGTSPTRTEVSTATVAAGQVNPAMAALSAFLAHAAPGENFVLGDLAVEGTGRASLFFGEGARLWSDLSSVVNAIETEFGHVQHVIECWYNSDASRIASFRESFWPMYFGTNADGSTFTLGSEGPNGSIVNHALWDGTAALGEKGRGIFARSQTMWHILTPMPFNNGPSGAEPEAQRFSQGLRLEEPARTSMISLADDALAQSVGVKVGPSAHISHFGGGIHPVTTNPDGQILFAWPFALALLRAAGQTINEPSVIDCEAAADGAYADLIIDLPNGGTLTTLRQFRESEMPATPSPHQQAVTGVELSRGANRRSVFNLGEQNYPASHRGTVTIQDSGSGTPRRGRVRITPEQPFTSSDALSYLRGQATAMLLRPRDTENRLYLDHLIEHIPALYDATATYPFEGVAVRPFQQDIAIPVPAASFVARGATFDGASFYGSTAASVQGSNSGMMSFWFRMGTEWLDQVRVFELRAGTNIVGMIRAASQGRLLFAMSGASANYATPTDTFSPNQWHHIMWSWDVAANRYQIFVDGTQLGTNISLGSNIGLNSLITRVHIGSASGGSSPLTGSLAHLWLSVTQSLDLTIAANRAKFSWDLAPVDAGADGAIPTGTAPEWYYDGEGPDFVNRGTAGNIPLIGGPLLAAPIPIP